MERKQTNKERKDNCDQHQHPWWYHWIANSKLRWSRGRDFRRRCSTRCNSNSSIKHSAFRILTGRRFCHWEGKSASLIISKAAESCFWSVEGALNIKLTITALIWSLSDSLIILFSLCLYQEGRKSRTEERITRRLRITTSQKRRKRKKETKRMRAENTYWCNYGLEAKEGRTDGS